MKKITQNDEPDTTSEPDNVDRLLKHLKTKSLAALVVRAHRGSSEPEEAVQAVLAVRLQEVRARLDGSAD